MLIRMKDHDVTWLYGPLQTLDPQDIYLDSPAYPKCIHQSSSFISKKPILKKRSVSEVMLGRSLSNSTLVLQAVDALSRQDIPKASDTGLTSAARASSYYDSSASSTPRNVAVDLPFDLPSPMTSSVDAASGTQTPAMEKRHIHFNNKVEQCIAINEEAEEPHRKPSLVVMGHMDDASEDRVTITHTKGRHRHFNDTVSKPSLNSSVDGVANKTIAMLPSTTLNYRSDTPEPSEQTYDRFGSFWQTGKRLLSHASSSETLRPTKPSANFLLDDQVDDDYDSSNGDEYNDDDKPHMTRPLKSSSSISRGNTITSHDLQSQTDEHDAAGHRGLRRTSSGMLMPFEGDEMTEDFGIVGKVLDTVNTARDIAHVIWNVGWRR